MQLECLAEIRQRFLFRLPLTGHVHFKTLGDAPGTFTPNCCSERTGHEQILTQSADLSCYMKRSLTFPIVLYEKVFDLFI